MINRALEIANSLGFLMSSVCQLEAEIANKIDILTHVFCTNMENRIAQKTGIA